MHPPLARKFGGTSIGLRVSKSRNRRHRIRAVHHTHVVGLTGKELEQVGGEFLVLRFRVNAHTPRTQQAIGEPPVRQRARDHVHRVPVAELHDGITRRGKQRIAALPEKLDTGRVGVRAREEIEVRLGRDDAILVDPFMHEPKHPRGLRVIHGRGRHGFVEHRTTHPATQRQRVDRVAEKYGLSLLPGIGCGDKSLTRHFEFFERPLRRWQGLTVLREKVGIEEIDLHGIAPWKPHLLAIDQKGGSRRRPGFIHRKSMLLRQRHEVFHHPGRVQQPGLIARHRNDVRADSRHPLNEFLGDVFVGIVQPDLEPRIIVLLEPYVEQFQLRQSSRTRVGNPIQYRHVRLVGLSRQPISNRSQNQQAKHAEQNVFHGRRKGSDRNRKGGTSSVWSAAVAWFRLNNRGRHGGRPSQVGEGPAPSGPRRSAPRVSVLMGGAGWG